MSGLTVPAGDLVTTRCRTCRTPVTPGHTGHDAPIDNGEETFYCGLCCPCMEGDDMSDETQEQAREAIVSLLERSSIIATGIQWEHLDKPTDGIVRQTERSGAFRLTIDGQLAVTESEPEPEPPRPSEPEHPEYALERPDERGHLAIADEVLVPAHSLRVGDRVEWAPGDWREIADVQEHRLAITLWFDDEPLWLNRWDLVAVRR